MSAATFEISHDELMAVFRQKYSRSARLGWGPRMRLQHGYFTPDDYYEALVGKLLAKEAAWCDVGCGRNIFPENPDLARDYVRRCAFVFGIDPDDNVRDNALVHDYFQGFVENCDTTRRFDLITLRMVAEHIEKPDAALTQLAALLKPDGLVVIYTPYKWSPMSIIADLTPFRLHNPLKRLLWRSEARDTFPTQYKLNTRSDIERHAARAGLRVISFQRLDDCRITNSFKSLNRVELWLRAALRSVGIPYPEACVLAVLGRKPREQ